MKLLLTKKTLWAIYAHGHLVSATYSHDPSCDREHGKQTNKMYDYVPLCLVNLFY